MKNVKRIAVILMAVLMLVTAMPLNGIVGTDLFASKASAAELAPTGQCGENVYWTFDSETGLLTISGTGEIYNYNSGESPFYTDTTSLKLLIKKIIVEDGVTSIGDFTFEYSSQYSNYDDYYQLTLPMSVKTVGTGAFINCPAITSVSFGENVNEIKESAFENCSSLKTVKINNTSMTIGINSFNGCNELTAVYFNGNALTWLSFKRSISDGNDRLENANAHYLKNSSEKYFGPLSYTVTDSAVSISFCDNGYVGALEIPEEINGYPVVEIADNSIRHCDYITEIFVPRSVKNIGDSAFYHCDRLKIAHLSEGVETIGDDVFSACRSWEALYIPSTVKSIGSGNFYSGFVLDTIEVSPKSEYFCTDEYGALYTKDYSELIRFPAHGEENDYTINNKTKVIRDNAFAYVEDLSLLVIPMSVNKIEERAFQYSKINYVGYEGTQEEWNQIDISETAFQGKDDIHDCFEFGKEYGTCGENITWVYDSLDKSLVIEGEGEMDNNASVSDYGWFAFINKIEYAEISDGVKNIGTNAFSGCAGLKEVYLGEDITFVDENAFADCTNLSIVSVTSDSFNAENAFSNNNSKLTFVISEGNSDAENFAKNNGYSVITAGCSADGNTIDFKGNTVVYKGLEYNYLTNYINEYSDAKYIHFDRLEFDGIKPEMIIIEDCENVVPNEKNFALDDLYVSLKVVIDGQEEQITFEKMFELFESGNYDAFKLKFNSESGETEESFFEKIEEIFVGFYTSALRVITKAINFVVGLFKKK